MNQRMMETRLTAMAIPPLVLQWCLLNSLLNLWAAKRFNDRIVATGNLDLDQGRNNSPSGSSLELVLLSV